MKTIKQLILACVVLFATSINAQVSKPLPTLHVEGKWLCDSHGNHVVLHGVMDTPSMWFNGYDDESGMHHSYWSGGYNTTGVTNCLNYFEKIFGALEQANCDVFRLHMDPAWSNDPDTSYVYIGSEGQAEGVGGEASIKRFNPSRYTTFLSKLYWPLIQKALNHKLYVVVRPPGVCPGSLKVGDYYNQYLMKVWDIFSQNSYIKKYSGQISIELANEPVSLKNADGQDDPRALHDFFQPIVDKIRANGFSGIIWAPGTGWQANYTSYETYPIEGANIGYAVHDYCGWYDTWDGHHDPQNKINQFKKQVPVVETAPIIITEVDWSPKKEGTGHYNEHGEWVESNYGTWATGSTSKWGMAYKAMLDYYGNISMTLSGTHCLLDILTLLNTGEVVPAFDGNEEACGKACMDWYADYYNVDWAHPDFKNVTYSDQNNGKYKNPLIFADFPDPDVIRVEDTYYMISTTMHNFPGATILKSKDLVNWEYCAQPLAQLSTKDRYSLLGEENAYGSGMWACSMTWHNGKFYILINGNDAGGFVLSATDPEDEWEKKQLPRIYYDPGMLFDNGKVYVACGIGNIQICELDEDFNFIREQTVIQDKDGLEGSHLYKIGDYYYIYATYGGWPSGQTIFRSENIFGPYEEKMLLEKTIDNKPNTIHQGALIETTEGEWWTILQEDLGAFGRMPNLQPVKWKDGWPTIGSNGTPYTTAQKKPNTGTCSPRTLLPTNDNFRSYKIGMQWQWNHNPDDGAWSLFERPGWLRMKTSGSANRLTQARNILTQRIFALHDKSTQPSRGTIRIDVSKLQEDDRAGICILQDPYAAIAVEKKNNKYQLVWWQDTLRVDDSFTPAQQTQEIEIDSIIYLRAALTYDTSKTQFSYSLDNENYIDIGDQTTLKYNLSVFVGARFGLFCYNTENGSEGYADFDWFSTEATFDEATFYSADFEGYSPEMLTAEKIEMAAESMEVMVGNNKPIQLTATFVDGHTEDVSAKAKYTANIEGIVEMQGGMIRGLEEGIVDVTATYTDPMGNEFHTTTSVRSSFFPFAAEYINTSLYNEGSFSDPGRDYYIFRTGQYGQVGWEYSNGADMSGYKYLVIKLRTAASAAHLNIFTSGNIWGDCCATPNFGNKKQVVLDLRTATYTSGNSTGQSLNTKNVRIVSFWADKATILVSDMYLTNNDDYSRSIPVGIEDIEGGEMASEPAAVYDLAGRRVANGNLPRGIYIIGNKKVAVK
jgi:beta-xylosidase